MQHTQHLWYHPLSSVWNGAFVNQYYHCHSPEAMREARSMLPATYVLGILICVGQLIARTVVLALAIVSAPFVICMRHNTVLDCHTDIARKTAQIFTAAIGIICPPLCYKLDALIDENEANWVNDVSFEVPFINDLTPNRSYSLDFVKDYFNDLEKISDVFGANSQAYEDAEALMGQGVNIRMTWGLARILENTNSDINEFKTSLGTAVASCNVGIIGAQDRQQIERAIDNVTRAFGRYNNSLSARQMILDLFSIDGEARDAASYQYPELSQALIRFSGGMSAHLSLILE